MYTCTSVRAGNAADFGSVVDVCGDSLTGHILTRTSGYVQSLNYPSLYPANLMCTCNISAHDSQSELVLQLLDLDTYSLNHGVEGGDWLQYSNDLEHWGSGHALQTSDIMRQVHTGSSQVHLNFRSDSTREGRGFWLQYSGET